MFTVGAFARLAGSSARALRLYDGLGLFRPGWTDPQTGYRFYSAAQLPELRRIIALRDAGLPLREIRDALAGEGLTAALARRRSALEAEKNDIERRLAALEIRVGGDVDGLADHDVVMRLVPREPVATFRPADAGGDIGAAFYELESHVRDLGRRAPRPPGALVPSVIAGDPADTELYVPLKRPISPTDRIGFRWLEEAKVATLLHRGPYDTLRRARLDLAAWVGRAGLAVAGRLRVLYLQFGAEAELGLPDGWVVTSESDFLTELQLPVSD